MANQSRLEVVLALINEASEELEQVRDDLDQTSDAADNLQEENDDTGFSFTELNSAMSIASQGLQMMQQGYAATIGKTLEYANTVRALSITIGATAEESSMLIQAADDVGVSSETLTGALESAIRKGVRPTIEGLGELADQYNAIDDPIERTAFLQDKFGKSGADLARLMMLGSDGIKAAGESAIETGQVMSGPALDSARRYEVAIDNLTDKAEGLVIQFSNAVIPVLSDAADAVNLLSSMDSMATNALAEHESTLIQSNTTYGAYIEEMTRAADVTGRSVITQDEYNEKITSSRMGAMELGATTIVLTQAQFEGAQATAAWADVLDRANDGFRDMTPAIEPAVISAEQMQTQLTILQAALSGPMKQAQDDYATKTGEIRDKQADLNFQIGEATRIYGENSPKVADLKTQYAGLTGELALVNEQYAQNINQLIFAAAQSALFADGVQAGEVPALMAMGEMLGLVDQGTADVYKKFSDLAEHNKAEGKPAWEGMIIESANLAKKLTTETTPAIVGETQQTNLMADASDDAHEQLGFVYNDLIGIKGAADSAAKSVSGLNGALNSIPQHVGPYSASSGGAATPGAAPPKFSSGGVASGPESGYPAELHGTEAVIPLPDGKSIPVQVSAGGSGDMRLVLSIPVILDGQEIGRASFDGTLAEARARGLVMASA